MTQIYRNGLTQEIFYFVPFSRLLGYPRPNSNSEKEKVNPHFF